MNANQVRTAAVVGAGTMGNGIAHVFSLAGIDVTLIDESTDALTGARANIEKNLSRQIAKNRLEASEAREALDRIGTATELAAAESAEVLVEAVPESRDLKLEIFSQLGDICSREAILASNTSSISITEIAAGVPSPGRFLGMHFMNPVPVMQLVEVIRGLDTDDSTV